MKLITKLSASLFLLSLGLSFVFSHPSSAFACDASNSEIWCGNCNSCKKAWEGCNCGGGGGSSSGGGGSTTTTTNTSNGKCESWCGQCGYTFVACGSYCPNSSQCGSAGSTDLRTTNGGSPNEKGTNNDPTVNVNGTNVPVVQPGQIAGGGTPTPTNKATNNNTGSSGVCDSGSNTHCVNQSFGAVVNLSQVSGVGDPWCCYRTGSTNSCNLNRCGCLYNSQADCQQCVRDPNNPSKCTSTTRTCSLGATTGCWTPSSGGQTTINTDCLTKVQCEKYGDPCESAPNKPTCYVPKVVPGVTGTTDCSSYLPTTCSSHPGCKLDANNKCVSDGTNIGTAESNTCIGGESACSGHAANSMNCGGSENNKCMDQGSVTINRLTGRNCICRYKDWQVDTSDVSMCLQADDKCSGKHAGDKCGDGTLTFCKSQGPYTMGSLIGNSCICRDQSWNPDMGSCTSGDSACIGKTVGAKSCGGANTECKGLAPVSSASTYGNACVCKDITWTQEKTDCQTKIQCEKSGDKCVQDVHAYGCYVPSGDPNAMPTITQGVNVCEQKGGGCYDLESKQCNDGGQIWNGGAGCFDGLSCCKPNSSSGSTTYTPSINCGNVSGQTLGNRCAGGGVYTSGGTNKNGSQICICTPPGGSTGDGSGVTTTGNCGGSGQNCCDPFSQNGKICNNGLYCNTTTGKCQNTPPTNLCQGGGSGGTPSTQCAVFKCGNSCNNGNQCTVNRSVVPCDQADVALGSQCGQIDFLDTNGAYCGVKNQHCGGSCTGTTNPTGNPTGTNPPSNPSGTTNPVPVCVEVNMYYKSGDNWVKTAVADIANHVHVGDEIRFSVVGRSGSFAKARFHIKINNGAWGDWIETTGKLANASGAEYYINYTVPAGKISVEGQLF